MRARLVASFILLCGLGCSARASGGFVGAGGDGGGGGGGGGGGSVDCNAICERLRGVAGCSDQNISACVSGCQSLNTGPAMCQAQASALGACAQTTQGSCTAVGFPFPSCNAQFETYSRCVATAPADAGTTGPTDAGSTTPTDTGGTTSDPCAAQTSCGACTAQSTCGWCAGRCWTGTGSGPVGGSCGGDSWAWLSSQCSAAPTDAGTTNPMIGKECQTCAISSCAGSLGPCIGDPVCSACVMGNLTPACQENPAFRGIIACACSACASQCGAFCG